MVRNCLHVHKCMCGSTHDCGCVVDGMQCYGSLMSIIITYYIVDVYLVITCVNNEYCVTL